MRTPIVPMELNHGKLQRNLGLCQKTAGEWQPTCSAHLRLRRDYGREPKQDLPMKTRNNSKTLRAGARACRPREPRAAKAEYPLPAIKINKILLPTDFPG